MRIVKLVWLMSKAKVSKLIIIDCQERLIPEKLLNSNTKVLNLSNYSASRNLMPNEFLPAEEQIKLRLRALKSIQDFGELKTNNSTIKELLSYNNSSIYFFHRLRIMWELYTHLFKVEEINYQLKHFSECDIFTTNKFIHTYFDKNTAVNFKTPKKSSTGLSMKAISSLLWYFLIRYLKGMFQPPELNPNIQYALIDRPTDYVGSGKEKQNPFLEAVVKGLKEQSILISELPIKINLTEPASFAQLNTIHINKRNVLYGEYIIISKGLKNLRTWKKLSSRITKRLFSIQSNTFSQEHKFVLDRYKQLNTLTKYYLLKEISYHDYFKGSKIKHLIGSDENSIAHRVIYNAAKSRGIKTYGVQHGAIATTSINYMYKPSDLAYSPIPDLTFIWGEYWQKLLTKCGHYPEDSLKIVGQLRTDSIPLLKKKTNNKQFIIYASQPMFDEVYREKALQDFLRLTVEYPEQQFLIRPHPREKDLSYFYDRITSSGATNIFIDGEADLYHQLAEAKLLITCFSTVAIEALYFDVPVALIDYEGMDILELKKKNLAPLCKSYKELKQSINLLLNHEFSNHAKLQEFVFQMAYRIDGKVSERIISYIQSNAI